ncbi:hypothetical protein CEQ21_02375 [Niallia circulans]|uniref:Spore germination protein KB n=1 Tax=Niallia circulans TaxID=1397 RepID=A0A553SS71_NIACI|nr:endospore germination permease [Niallia circulans]TRZ39811.1 hypothetical protein CEQ21_02375 [Niallia circulans]
MEIKKIETLELASMIILFQLGSSIVLGMGMEAKKDAWMAIGIATAIGIAIHFCYVALYRAGGTGKTFTRILQDAFSRPVGIVISTLYYLYFLYLAARVTGDFAFFINEVILWSVSAWVIKLSILLLVAYVCYLDIETLGRSSQALTLIMLTFLILVIVFMFFLEDFHWTNLRPMLEDGFSPVIKAVFPTLMTFPFGEVIVFICYYQYLTKFSTFQKKGWMAVLISGVTLIIIAVLNVGLLTADLAKIFTFPFMKTIEHINFLNFIRHLELLAVLVFTIGGLIKITIFSYAGIQGLAEIFKLKKKQMMIIPFLLAVYFISAAFMNNFVIHLYIGLKIVPLYVHLVFQFLIPILCLVMLLIKILIKKWKRRNLKA